MLPLKRSTHTHIEQLLQYERTKKTTTKKIRLERKTWAKTNKLLIQLRVVLFVVIILFLFFYCCKCSVFLLLCVVLECITMYGESLWVPHIKKKKTTKNIFRKWKVFIGLLWSSNAVWTHKVAFGKREYVQQTHKPLGNKVGTFRLDCGYLPYISHDPFQRFFFVFLTKMSDILKEKIHEVPLL